MIQGSKQVKLHRQAKKNLVPQQNAGYAQQQYPYGRMDPFR